MLALFTAALVGGGRLVQLLDELFETRTELAAAAVDHERLRVSRDLPDLLGQSLSAISLKGDLALWLLDRDTAAAAREIESLTEVARTALHDARAVTRDEHAAALRTEIDGAATLLGAAGVRTTLEVAELPPLPVPTPWPGQFARARPTCCGTAGPSRARSGRAGDRPGAGGRRAGDRQQPAHQPGDRRAEGSPRPGYGSNRSLRNCPSPRPPF